MKTTILSCLFRGLQVRWHLNTAPPQSNGNILFATDALSPGNHTITLTAEDETEETCNASIQLSVGTHPAIIGMNQPIFLCTP